MKLKFWKKKEVKEPKKLGTIEDLKNISEGDIVEGDFGIRPREDKRWIFLERTTMRVEYEDGSISETLLLIRRERPIIYGDDILAVYCQVNNDSALIAGVNHMLRTDRDYKKYNKMLRRVGL